MDVALLTSNVAHLREAMELRLFYKNLLIGLFSLSIVLQVVASCIVVVKIYYKDRSWSVKIYLNSSVSLTIFHFQVQCDHWNPHDNNYSRQHSCCSFWRSWV